jgi:archaellum component FlaC
MDEKNVTNEDLAIMVKNGFDGLRLEMNERFEKVDERFEKVDERFENIENILERMDRETTQRITHIEDKLEIAR